MISSKLKEQLGTIRSSGKVPGVLLVTGLYNVEEKSSKLEEIAREMDGGDVSEAKGGLVFLTPEDSNSIKVDDVRDLLKKISLRNWSADQKRYILIPQAELLTVQSSNALLKSLEEAPQGTHFILGAPAKRSVLKTIQSRSFIVSEDQSTAMTPKEEGNSFYKAFFEKSFEQLSKTVRTDLKAELQDFSLKIREVFVEEAYSGELNHQEWHRLFDFIDELDQKIEANMDTKWVLAAVERFSFNG